MSEQLYAVIKDNNVINTLIFDNPSEELLNTFISNYNADKIILGNAFTQVGGTYDGSKFWLQQPYPSWTKDEELNDWEPPVPYPDDDKTYQWNEDILNWEEIQVSE